MFGKVFNPVFVTLFTCCSFVDGGGGSSSTSSPPPDRGSGVRSTPGNASGVESAPGINDFWVKRGFLVSPPPAARPHPRDILSSTLQHTPALTDVHTLPGTLTRSVNESTDVPSKSATSAGSAKLRRAWKSLVFNSPAFLYTDGPVSSTVHHTAVPASPLGSLYHSGPLRQLQVHSLPPTVYSGTPTSPSTPIITVATVLPHFALVPVALTVGPGEGHAQRGVVQSSGRLPPSAELHIQEEAKRPNADGQSSQTQEEKPSLGLPSSDPPDHPADALQLNDSIVYPVTSPTPSSVATLAIFEDRVIFPYASSTPSSVTTLAISEDRVVFPNASSTPSSVTTLAISEDRVVFPYASSTPSSAASQATPSDKDVFPSTSATPSAETIIFPSGSTTLSTSPPPTAVTTHGTNGTTSDDVEDLNNKVSIIVPGRPCRGPCEVANGGVCVVDLLCQKRHTDSP